MGVASGCVLTDEAALALGSEDLRDSELRAEGEVVIVWLYAISEGGEHEELACRVGYLRVTHAYGVSGVMLTAPVMP